MSNIDVLVIDYGVGNVTSVTNALERLGYRYVVSADHDAIAKAPRFILPGVGAFAEAMNNLESRGLVEPLRREVLDNKKPLLGICLGMQVLADSSAEGGEHKGLGLIPGKVLKIAGAVRVPHVGWETLEVGKKDPLFARVPEGGQFYFDHSYHVETAPEFVAATAAYGTGITAAVQKDNIYGVQFHPEKSHLNGLRLIKGFVQNA